MSEDENVKFFTENDLEPASQAFSWYWQSDPDPWKEKDETKCTWTAYPQDISFLIEDAYSTKQKVVNIGGYEIDFERMVQINKVDRSRIRRVKRDSMTELESRFLTELPKPMEKEEKTINDAFGNVHHFLNYIMKRTPAAYTLYQRLKRLSLDCKESEYIDIVKEVINCITQGAEAREKVANARRQNRPNECMLEADKIVNEIKLEARTLKNFLQLVLRIYTMESFVCYYINELLRNENWKELNILTPYLVCLTYSFQIKDYVIKYERPKGVKQHFFQILRMKKLVLYRGTTLAEEHLKHYVGMKNRHFSWNAVTSTTRSRDVALRFTNLSLQRAKKQSEQKIGVIFKIKTDFCSPKDCEGIIDISTYSRYPQEQEVILAPGTVFKVVQIKENQKDRRYFEIKLKLKKKFDENKENLSLLGTLHSKVILGNRAVLYSLSQDEIIKALQLLEGNKLIRTLEIRNCVIDAYLMELIENMRTTTNIPKVKVLLADNKILVSGLDILDYYFSAESMDSIFALNRVEFTNEDQEGLEEKDFKMRKLVLRNQGLSNIQDQGQMEVLCRKVSIQREIREMDLEISFNIDHVKYLLATVRCLNSLRKLSMGFSKCFWLNDDKLKDLKKVLISKLSLEYLALDFKNCLRVSDNGIRELMEAVGRLKALNYLSLGFYNCKMLSDSGLVSIREAMGMLKSVGQLYLDFGKCPKISDKGLDSVKDAIKMLTCLEELSLSFKECSQLTDKGFKNIRDSFKEIIDLKHLCINFEWCSQISDHGLNSLKDAIRMLRPLQTLSLNFYQCQYISDSGLDSLKGALKHLDSLQHLTLDFKNCSQISDRGINSLKEALKLLGSLQHLSLDFRNCYLISDEGLDNLKEGLIRLTSLIHLSLNFERCSQISDNGFNYLKEALKMLMSLEYLSLKFWGCERITGDVLNSLGIALKSLISLNHLSLDFGRRLSQKVLQASDTELIWFKDSLKMLTSLNYLSLNFDYCYYISDMGLSSLKEAIETLKGLRHLSLGFSECKKITDAGLNNLRDALKSLVHLQHLCLCFGACELVSDTGLDNLGTVLKLLTSLQYLSLTFGGCEKMKENVARNLIYALETLPFLSEFQYRFYFTNGIMIVNNSEENKL